MSHETDRQSRGRRAQGGPREEPMAAGELPDDGLPFGRYRLLKRLSYGGMGEIFLAKHDGLGGFSKLLVIKRLLQHYRGDADVVAMFFDEAKLQALMNDRHIVQIWDMGQVDDQYFIAMEYVEGTSWRRLGERLREEGAHLHPAHAVDLVVQACRGLGYAHNLEGPNGNALSLVHRDVNPQNILVSYGGEVKLIDFGIAKSELSGQHTETGTIKGKFAYMSPEQARAEPLDRRSDIFSMGICFYELLTGQNPFHRKNVVLSLEAICEQSPPPVEELRPDAAALAPVVERCMAKNPDERFADCAELEEALVSLYLDGLCGEPEETLGELLLRLFADDIERQSAFLQRNGFAPLAARRTGASDPGVPSPLARPGEGTRRMRRNLSESQASSERSSLESEPPAADTHPTATIASLPSLKRQRAAQASGAPAPVASPEGAPRPQALAPQAARPRFALVAAGAVLGLLMVALGGFLLFSSDGSPDEGSTSRGSAERVVATVEAVRVLTPDEEPAPEPSAADDPNEAVEAEPAEGAPEEPAAEEPAEDEPVEEIPDEEEVVPEASPEAAAEGGAVMTPVESARERRPSKRRPPREKRTEPVRAQAPVEAAAPAAAAGTLTINAGGPFTIQGRGVRGRNVAKVSLLVGESRTLTISGGPLKVRLRVSASAQGADIRVESEPWAIVRANNIGRGRTPQSVRVEPGGPVQLLLKNPAAGEMRVTLGMSR